MEVKAQAAVTDALFLLMIITGLSIFLFSFTSTYGTDIDASITRQYSIDYVTDSLKTILYSSTLRESENDLTLASASEPKEIDYLLAVIKEDIAESNEDETDKLSGSTKIILKKNIEKIMLPIADQFDYLFFIAEQTTAGPRFIYFLIYKSEFSCFTVQGTEIDCEEEARNVLIQRNEPKSHNFYLCNSNAGYEITSRDISRFLFNLGDAFQSSAPLLLIKTISDSSNELKTETGTASLIIWPATLIKKENLDLLQCSVFEDIVIEETEE